MALAMTPVTMAHVQDDVMDIDIDMDVDDIGPVADDEILEEGEEPSIGPIAHQVSTGEVAAIYLEDPAQETAWEKIHIRGVDDMSTDNIRMFASDYFSEIDPYVQWVDDTSANLVYKDKATARRAFLTFTQQPVTEQELLDNPFELRTARPFVTKPASMLTVRMAMMGDRKRKGAKDASRYYLLHPEADPAERIRREKTIRGDNGDYKRRRFDDKEHKRRQRHHDDNADSTNDFAASMYDDAPSKPVEERGREQRDLFSRITNPRNRSASPISNGDAISVSDSEEDTRARRRRNGYRNRDSPPPRRRNNVGRELFDAPSDPKTGSGMRSDNVDLYSRRDKQNIPTKPANMTSYEANQGVARQLRADLKAAQNQSPARSHRRSRAVDSRVEEDLAERFGRKSLSLDSTKSVTQKTPNTGKELFTSDRDMNMDSNGFSIKGSANHGMSIKGRADNVKELFPDRFSTGGDRGTRSASANAGKELFDQPVRAKTARRNRATDLFD